MRAYPSIETIAADTRSSPRSVNRALPELEKKGCFVIIKTLQAFCQKGRNTIREKTSTTYHLGNGFVISRKSQKVDKMTLHKIYHNVNVDT